MRTMFDLPEIVQRPSGRSRPPRAAPVSVRCPFDAGSSERDAWKFGHYDVTQRYVACVPFAGRERAVAYLHGYYDTRAGATAPSLPVAALDAAWHFGVAVAAAGAPPGAAIAALTAAVEYAFEQAYAAAPDG